MSDKQQRQLRRIGIIVGAWLIGLYALMAETVNRVALPEVPLGEPSGGWFGYLFSYLLVGGILGLVCCWPSSTLGGAVAGGAAGALGILGFNWIGMLDAPSWMGGMTIVTFISFLPMTLLLSPAAFLARFASETFVLIPHPTEKPRFSRWWRPVIVSLIFLALGYSSIYPTNVRNALQTTYDNVKVGLTGEVPTMLDKVWKFPSGADGTYILEYVDSWETYAGQYSASLDPLSAFLIKARFSNGFTISCLFSSSSQPVCLNEEFPFGE